ncbi:glycosyltransferase family 2 protein [Thiohalorhabdus methylotrophus]|uniref:Glycosyltransferase family 2 protein n=1 Tax=Thiohalorhabdus methylotrophus TaxID=3242694 RepID=A0ABV4TT55_9GAMM
MGDRLIERGLLTPQQLEAALALQRRWGTRLGDVLLAQGWVRPYAFYSVLAEHFGRPFVDFDQSPPDPSLWREEDLTTYTELLVLPWGRSKGGILTFAVADPDPEALQWVRERAGEPVDFVITSKFDIIWQVQRHSEDYLSDYAVNELFNRDPVHSARRVFTKAQIAGIYTTASLALVSLAVWPITTLLVFNAGLAFFLLINFGLRVLFTWVGSEAEIDIKVTGEEVAALANADLPTYTVLVPMYNEPEVLPLIVDALRKMDYPLSKLDVKLVLEEGDEVTISAAKEMGLEGIFEIIRVPPSLPKTKPKACNYALAFARGDLVTIYDAEDQPEPDQMKRAVLAFRKSRPGTAVIQARLNYFNREQNWLTRLFTLEYSLWFDFYLPALEALHIPIPLGGTSNHFDMHILRSVQAWDPYNVTEDADLGVRFTQLDYHVGVVNSTTYEEANSRLGNWIRQRSRWIKGYMQTYLVHMRRPLHLYRTLGHTGFWGFQFFIGGSVLNALLAPVLYLMFAWWLITHGRALDPLFPAHILNISLFNLLIGNGFLIYLSMVSVFKRHLYRLIPYALTAPAYWLLQSVAAYKALWQLIHKPFFWEKTAHGLTGASGEMGKEGKA